MSLLADISAERPRRRGPVCSVQQWLNHASDADRDDLLTALADERIETSRIWRALKGHGFTSGLQALQRHRNGGCACG